MPFDRWLVSLFLALSLAACQSSPTRAPIAPSDLQGRFFLIGRNLTTPPQPDIGVVQYLYEMSSSGGPLALRLRSTNTFPT
jgi:hypothetical protein